MLQLNPREHFYIVRQIPDPGDTVTYYVRATIRNSKDDTIIDVVNLTDRGGQRFSKIWDVCPDVSGLGLYIDITTNVYTDSGYTTLSTVYGSDTQTYLVLARAQHFGGSGVNYDSIRKIIKEEINKIPPVEIPKPEKVDLSGVIYEIDKVQRSIAAIKFPKIPTPDKIDMSPIVTSLKTIRSEIQNLDLSVKSIVIPETDLSEIIDTQGRVFESLNILSDSLQSMNADKSVINKINETKDVVSKFINGMVDGIRKTPPEENLVNLKRKSYLQ